MAQTYFVVPITVGEPETGLWCPTCLAPSALRFPLYIIRGDGVTSVGHFIRCCDCGWDAKPVPEVVADVERRLRRD